MTDMNQKLREALQAIADWDSHDVMLGVDFGSNGVRDFYRRLALEALALPTQQSQIECTRSHPHELMSPECELRTEIARLTNENADLKERLARSGVDLRRAVANERDACVKVCNEAKAKSRNHLFRSGLSVAAGEIRARGEA